MRKHLDLHYPDTQLLMMAKVPRAGYVKTRMQPQLTPDQSMQLHTALVQQCLQQWYDAQLCELTVWVGGDPACFQQHFPCWQFLPHHTQPKGDLGQRMLFAIQQSLMASSVNKEIIVGADCPFIDAAYLEQAITALDHHDVVIGPAADGGYVLLAMKTPHVALFKHIEWGSANVFAKTEAQLIAEELSFQVLPTLHDIDYVDDLSLLDKPHFSSVLKSFSQSNMY